MNYADIANKKILLICPHQDDEINLGGGVIYSLSSSNEIYVAYVTNGDYNTKASIRYKEAINALKKLGVKKGNIIFLGYPDTSYNENEHMYHDNNFEYCSKSNHLNTYGANKIGEYCYQSEKVHKLYKKENLIIDIKNLILDIMPDVIICNDLDFHCDHIMTSLCFENAMGRILSRKSNSYFPLVLKSFCYENSYNGKEDFNQAKNVKQIFKLNDKNLCSNPYYDVKNGIDFMISKKCHRKLLILNPIFQAINCHNSQVLQDRIFRIINANYFYFPRYTKNLINQCKIDVSSNEKGKKYLNDFLINDSNYILHGDKNKIIYDKGIWIPEKEDNQKKISIFFDKPTYIYQLNLYIGNNGNKIQNINVKTDFISNKYIIEKLKFQHIIDRKVKKIEITILDKNPKTGFSEIELLETPEYVTNSYDVEDTGNKLVFSLNKIFLYLSIFKAKVIRKIIRYF